MSATYWIVASSLSKTDSKEGILSVLKSRVGEGKGISEEGWPPVLFHVPDGDHSLRFGSFDNLIRLTDELQKHDQQVEGILRRLDRQYCEVHPTPEFQVLSQRAWMSFDRYIRNWQWDDAKYPKSRGLTDNLTMILQTVSKLDEEARNKAAQYNELKAQRGNLTKKDAAGLLTKDLVDVFTPEAVKMNGSADDDFIYSEYLTTVVVIVSRSTEKEFLACYEVLAEKVVPSSARKFHALDDKDGNSLIRVVMFRSAVDTFKKNCRDKRFTVRDFEYSEEAYKKLKVLRDQNKDDCDKQDKIVRGFCKASWSDVMVAWVHVKAMRVFVESVLRFGVPPCFASFLVSPKPKQEASMRRALADILGKSKGAVQDKLAEGVKDDEEEYFPYVSLSFVPFAPRAA